MGTTIIDTATGSATSVHDVDANSFPSFGPAIQVAGRIAVSAHQGQVDKQAKPYIDQPFRVAAAAFELAQQNLSWRHTGQSPLVYIVGLLHDAVEDSDLTIEDVSGELAYYLNAEHFAVVVSALVAITKQEGESYEDYLSRVQRNAVARTVKLADIADNFGRLDGLPPIDRPRLAARYIHARSFLER